ncbi:MAG TPA: TonB family protein [Bryobacteraceae bacterium]|jgi:TonB family protein
MTTSIIVAMLAISSSLAGSIVAKATVTTALGLLGAWLTRRSRAAVRHAILAATFGMLPALPIAAIFAPPIRIAVWAAPPERVASTAGEMIPAVLAEQASIEARPASRSWRPSLSTLLLSGWIAGVALFLLPVLIGLRQIRRWRRSARPWPLGQSEVDQLARDCGIARRLEVLLHEALPGPMTCGVLHPAILMPPDAQSWDGENLKRAIVHELEHIRRGDWLTQCLARLICAVYWFHPLVWMAWRRLALAAERSCDDAVLGSSEATAYAEQLVGLAKRLSIREKAPLVAMANHADLSARVNAVLDSRQRRGRAGKPSIAFACTAAAVLVTTMSPLAMVAAPPAPAIAAGVLQIAPPEIALAQVAVAALRHAPAGPRIFQFAAPATSTPRFFGSTTLVIANVVVPDMTGKNIEGLRYTDFAITEDDAPQTIVVFEPVPAPPATVAQAPVLSYYILGYYTSNRNMDGAYRKIKITRTDDPTGRIEYRNGYYYDKLWQRAGGPAQAVPRTDQDSSNPGDPVAIYKAEANYSEEARKAKWQGTATLSVDIDATGAVTNAQVIRSLGLGLDEKALEAVKQWKFTPGTRDGNPVPVQAQVQFSFRLL